MDNQVWSNLSSSAEVLEDTAMVNSTVTLPTLRSSAKQTVSSPLVATIGLIISSVGTCANGVVLFVMFRARREFGSTAHTLLANQSLMDLVASVFGIGTMAMMSAGVYQYSGHNAILEGAVCMLFEGVALTATGVTAEKIGLMVITVERYFKIVHAIAHRKHYRDWMTKVGVALPWIGGLSLVLFPGMGTTRIVNGRCLRMGVWPTEGMAKAFSAVRFLWQYVIPVSVFAYCYGRIFHTIRRQSKVVTGHASHGHGTTTTGGQNTGQVQQQSTGASTGAKLSRTEMNVLQTMIAVIIVFILCWSVSATGNFISLLGVSGFDRNAFLMAGSFAYISLCINPFIYASRYEVFRRYLKQMLKRGPVTSSSAGGVTNVTQATSVRR